jgi:hypothetical protein
MCEAKALGGAERVGRSAPSPMDALNAQQSTHTGMAAVARFEPPPWAYRFGVPPSLHMGGASASPLDAQRNQAG